MSERKRRQERTERKTEESEKKVCHCPVKSIFHIYSGKKTLKDSQVKERKGGVKNKREEKEGVKKREIKTNMPMSLWYLTQQTEFNRE